MNAFPNQQRADRSLRPGARTLRSRHSVLIQVAGNVVRALSERADARPHQLGAPFPYPTTFMINSRGDLTVCLDRCQCLFMTATVESFIQEYARRYSDHDPDAVTELCLYPFLAIRGGVPIHLPDRVAVRDHFATIMDTYRGGGAATWSPVAIDIRRLGEHAAFATVRWNALDTEGTVVRDTETTYHLLTDPDGWRFLSYTNHF